MEVASYVIEVYGDGIARQVASTLFQRTLDIKKKNKWNSNEDDMVRTFFYLTSKEELCESLQCDMESLYKRACYLGVVSPSFETLTSSDLLTAVELFSRGVSQEEVLSLFGIKSVTVPVQSLNMNHYQEIQNTTGDDSDPKQMGLFDNED